MPGLPWLSAEGAAVPGLPADAVVEIPCAVDASGIRPLATRPLEGHMLGLVQQIKAVEELTIRAALERDERAAVAAFALHPLIGGVGAQFSQTDDLPGRGMIAVLVLRRTPGAIGGLGVQER